LLSVSKPYGDDETQNNKYRNLMLKGGLEIEQPIGELYWDGAKSSGKKNKSKNKKGGNSYLSVNNDTSAYTRYGAPGKCCGPNWRYSSIKAGKNKKRNKRTNKKKTKKGGGEEKSFRGQVWYGIESYPDDGKIGVTFIFGSDDQGKKYVKVPGYIGGTYKHYIQEISDGKDCSRRASCPKKIGELR
jgi:hypothetical protein